MSKTLKFFLKLHTLSRRFLQNAHSNNNNIVIFYGLLHFTRPSMRLQSVAVKAAGHCDGRLQMRR